jgi:hypothetical protein
VRIVSECLGEKANSEKKIQQNLIKIAKQKKSRGKHKSGRRIEAEKVNRDDQRRRVNRKRSARPAKDYVE